MRILVTGAFGYVGARLSRTLALEGHEVVLAGRHIPAWATAAFPRHRLVQVDVLDAATMASTVVGSDAIVHLASLNERGSAADPALAAHVRREGTRSVLHAARSASVDRVVFFSTFHVYAPTTGGVIDEETALAPAGPYGDAQLAGEQVCAEANARDGWPTTTILRISNVYGRPIDAAVARWTLAHNDLCRQAATSGKIEVRAPGSRRDLVWIEDVAQAAALVARTEPAEVAGRTFNVGGSLTMRMGDLAELVRARAERVLGHPVAVTGEEGADDPSFVYSIERLARLGYVPRDRLAAETDAIIEMLVANGSSPARGTRGG